MNERTISLKDGGKMPTLGQGTWYMGENRAIEEQEIESIRLGITMGMTLLDTAEMYGDGQSERMLGKAIAPLNREELFLVSKVYPWNAGKAHIFESCENSLKRLGTDYLDLYLLHWPGSVPLAETVDCMEQLVSEGKIKRWGVSNFDTADMKKLFSVPSGDKCSVNQVLYHLGSRGVEYDLLPWMLEHDVAMMAYCPIAQGGSLRRQLLTDKTLNEIAREQGITVIQLLLAFVLRQKNTAAIPKAGHPQHTKENAQTGEIKLTEAQWARIEKVFPAPTHKMPLDIQ